jgi:hypothetical protein
MMRISFEGKFCPAIRATKLAFNNIGPTGIILHIRKVGKRREFDNSPVSHESAQPPHKFGQLPGG